MTKGSPLPREEVKKMSKLIIKQYENDQDNDVDVEDDYSEESSP